MDPSYQFDGRAFYDFQQNGRFNDVSMELLARHRANELQALSPGQLDSRHSSYGESPTSPTSAHRPAVSQPGVSALGLQPGYYPTGSADMLQAKTSPVSPVFTQSFSDSMDVGRQYVWGGSFGDMSTNVGGSITMSRNNSENTVNQLPTPRRSTVGSNHSGQQYQQRFPTASSNSLFGGSPDPTIQNTQFESSITSPFAPPPAPSPPNPAPTAKTSRRTKRSHTSNEPIGHVYENPKKFKCIKADCKDLTFGRMADLRRHHAQHHAKNRVEFFCREPGCPRAHVPAGGASRSFGTRRDKRDEHERNVHKRERSRESSHSSQAEI